MRFLRRRASDPSAGVVPRECPDCGSPKLVKEKHPFTAIHLVEDDRSVSCRYNRIQVVCKRCRFLVNDDLNGDAAQAYARLTAQVGGSQVDLTAEVAGAVRVAGRLPALPDAERQRDYDLVRKVWGCAGMHPVPADELADAMARIIRGYFAEGAFRVKVETLDEPVLMLSFATATGFRPVRLTRGQDGDFFVYGQIQLTRVLGVI
ncbi:hypothetical protein [Kibdelosporangium phytohabitans]|uniref:Uncharacterized protein n=1 Tax=Kibdelosporangium phytohabitans TaxID=860235 RepID=A0A0N9IBA6_9PSEU|nr:hypothetical protein [Kibdelosporangium phytohabitans]ALG11963.1 hypothetical protein AOZ06_38410 [Kibdelosporangium phytohabitans]MBE1463428.1 RNA polymerase subunit RPABC4/transcription elongation factor Spt4 [Kibdelosporangium phytohabitans]